MKNKHVFLFLAAGFFALASVGCGKRHSAKKLVENFIDEHAQQPSVSITDVGKLDSTDRVDNSTINALQADVKNGGLYKPDTKFGRRPANTKTLLMIRVTLETKDEKGEKKQYKQTFYLDPELTSVVAVKTN
ncbi:MAG: hypothetical protein ACFN4S_11415 [Prevotella conceptionensis]|jgi:hypothetical protein|uniref:hypothetical protein n=1 Tax=Prevotella conceptionensis TaxID=340486 RepID=UPI0005C9A915|nr:hypothetical protein [Prevotella conceptionensis]